ncbi:MAG: aminotransferase class V-fold PLP-dependent enzyme [Microthrixaceae bacterium]
MGEEPACGWVYVDNAATTALSEPARAAMEPFLGVAGNRTDGPEVPLFGNPSGSHRIAREATRALDEARERVAEALGCAPGEVVFTSGGTEADNLAVTGGLPVREGRPVCSAVEHPAVLGVTRALGGDLVAVDRTGRVDLDALAEVLDLAARTHGGVSVVSVMTANNELGTINDIDAVAAVVAEHSPGTPLHTDAVQAAPWLDLAEVAGSAQLVSVSAHKLGGPKGTGALVVRSGTTVRPLLHGGGQERNRRGGTHDVAGIVGFAAALGEAVAEREARCRRVAALRDDLRSRLVSIDGVSLTLGDSDAPVLPGHLHVLVEGVVGEELLLLLEQRRICASAASSCSSGASAPSHVLGAIGAEANLAPLRLSLGSSSGPADVRAVAEGLEWALRRVGDRGADGARRRVT